MSGFTHDQIFALICEHCNVGYLGPDETGSHPQNFDLSREVFQKLNRQIAGMHSAAHVWPKPAQIEADIEDARKKLASAIESVDRLDGYAMSLARRQADRDAGYDDLTVAINGPEPIDQWVDHAAVIAMKRLRDALVYPVERAIPNAPTGPGRPQNRRAYAVAECAYIIFEDLTGTKPTFWNGGETPFSRLLDSLYSAYGIQSTLRKPIEAAMHKFNPNG